MSSRPFPVIITAATNPLARPDLERLAEREALAYLERLAETARADGAGWHRVAAESILQYVVDCWGHANDDLEHAEAMAAILEQTGWLILRADGSVAELRVGEQPTEQDRERSLAAWHTASEIAS